MPTRSTATGAEHPHGSGRPLRSLVTGGAGFIGSHLVDLLLSRGDSVTIIDNLSTGRRSNIPESHPRLRFIEADLGHALSALGPGEQFDEVYHLAAAVGVKLVVDEPIQCIEANIDETARLLRFVVDHGPDNRPARTLIASSSEVYGKAERSPFSEDDDVVYGPTTRSRWSYACSKAIDEYLALAYHQKYQLPVVVARFFNTVGPRQIGSYGMVLPNFVTSALRNEPLSVYGDGAQSRCFCDVRDVVRALPRLVGAPACHGRVFNVGADRSITIADLARLVIKTLNSSSDLKRVPYDQAYSAGFEDLRKREPDLSRIRAAIGFEFSIPLEQTIRNLAEHIRAGASRTAMQETTR
jgi:UDP-glucose 4-epimerase